MPTSRLFPRRTLESALRVPLAIKQHNAGNPWSTEEVARALNVGRNSGNFFYITASARDYGLTEGTRETTQISLTPLGRQVAYPATRDDERDGLFKAFLSVPAFKQVLEYYGGNNLPERQFLSNTLVSQFNIPETQHDEFIDLFTKNCKFLGIGKTFDAKHFISGQARPHVRDGLNRAFDDQIDDGAVSDTVTVGAPEDAADAPVCFVIMPFTEREDDHPPGFFDEVLEQVFTPAAKNAGFLVRTAMRQGSDIIQSTIVNELLEADLVLCDLTEHNPNVLFELGLRMREEKPVALVKSRGTGRVFDVDNMLRVVEYNPNLWPSSVVEDVPKIEEHIKATWANRDSERTFMRILRQQSPL